MKMEYVNPTKTLSNERGSVSSTVTTGEIDIDPTYIGISEDSHVEQAAPEPTASEQPAPERTRTDILLDQINVQKVELDSGIVFRVKNALVRNEFQPFDFSDGQSIEDYVADTIIEELEKQKKYHSTSAKALKETAVNVQGKPLILTKGGNAYWHKDITNLSIRADSHEFIAHHIDSLIKLDESTSDDPLPGVSMLVPKYLAEAIPLAQKEIDDIYNARERQAALELDSTIRLSKKLGAASLEQTMLVGSLNETIVTIQAEKDRVEAELRAEIARLKKELQDRDFHFWELDMEKVREQISE